MDYYITYWTIGGSKASCGLEPRNVRFHCKAETEQKALEKLFNRHPQLDSGNIISINCNRRSRTMNEKTNKLFKKSVEKCFEYRKNHTRFNLNGKKYDIDGNIWNNNFWLNEIIKMEGDTIVEDKKIIESQNMEDIAKYLWNLAGKKIA